jgi:hypothetical protein
LQSNLERHSLDNILSSVSVSCDPSIDAVRCVGNHNKDKKPAFPRMHNKFLVFAKKGRGPYAVWTGSFNLTRNAGLSLENALYITQPKIINAYF